jgi:XTP/dITP diphosphohydrolase
MNTLLIASTNPGKLREMQSILQDLPIQLLLPSDMGVNLAVEEDGISYLENARKKALAYCQAGGLPALADDSGLEVDLLGGEPGLYSARYLPKPGATDADRRRFLCEKLAPFPHPWYAHFHCTVVIATPAGELFQHSGNCYGQIIAEDRGENGFGYDPIFYFSELGKTMAELKDEQKNRISHRALALKAARPSLEQLFLRARGGA